MGRGQKEHLRRLRRVTGYMVLYPLAYIILSLPLAAGRMAMARGERLSIVYLCTAGAVISSSGFVDVIMYALTRRALLLDSQPSNIDRAYGSGRYQLNNGHMATVTADPRSSRGLNYLSYHHHRRRESERTQCRAPADDVQTAESNLEMLGFGKVYQKTTIEITSEPADIEEGSTPGRSTPSGPSCDLMNPVDPIQTPGRAWIGPKGGC